MFERHLTFHIPALKYETLVLVLAALFLLIQTVLPFKDLDMAVARWTYTVGGGGWITPAWWSEYAYRTAKIVSTLIFIGMAFIAFRAYRLRETKKAKAYFLALVSGLVTLFVMTLLKSTSGVACPWSLAEFSGSVAEHTAPFAYLLSGTAPMGRCFPAGHACCGFALFGLYFAAKRLRNPQAPSIALAVLAFGAFCGIGRMANGAHFLSHTTASLLLGFVVAGFVFRIFWPEGSETPDTTDITPTALAAGFALTVLSLPFFSEVVRAHTGALIAADVALFILFWAIWTGFIALLMRLMPSVGWRILLAFLVLAGGFTDAFTVLYGTVMTPDMLRNALATDTREAAELLGWRLFTYGFLLASPGLVVALFTPKVSYKPFESVPDRLRYSAVLVFTLVFALTTLLINGAAFISAMRTQKETRYLIEPISLFYSLTRTVLADASPESVTRTVIDANPTLTGDTKRPLLVVFVVGETVRAQNWGLNGYTRDTTPNLRKQVVVNFTDVTSCGTSTDVSLPCMLSRVGRANYDRKRILSEESILSVIERAGVTVRWVDNQSGSKGTATDSMKEAVVKSEDLCPKGECVDGVMLKNVEKAIAEKKNRELLVLHMIGNHGPAYWRRTPKEFRPFGQGCLKDEFASCSPEEIRVSYDNAVSYTDRVLSDIIDRLKAAEGIDTVLLYVSDHGESLGEKGLWLHGAPYWMRLEEQTKVPMILWMNRSSKARYAVIDTKIPHVASSAVSHDFVAETLLSLTQVTSRVYTGKLDLIARLSSGEPEKLN